MATCARAHTEYDRYANGELQAGLLPAELHVQGRVAWYVPQGPSSTIARAFPAFLERVQSKYPGQVRGTPGDVYVGSPDDHRGAAESSLMTLFWVPLA
jgi:hypothetical protein